MKVRLNFFHSLKYAVFVSKVIKFWYTTSRRVMFGGIYCVYTRVMSAAFFWGPCSRSYVVQFFSKNKFEHWLTLGKTFGYSYQGFGRPYYDLSGGDFAFNATVIRYFPDPSHQSQLSRFFWLFPLKKPESESVESVTFSKSHWSQWLSYLIAKSAYH